jgi:hypothetical protein
MNEEMLPDPMQFTYGDQGPRGDFPVQIRAGFSGYPDGNEFFARGSNTLSRQDRQTAATGE